MPETVGRSRITVRSGNVFERPLLDTDKAASIEFRDGFGDLVAVFGRVFNDEMWSFVTKSDPDWHAALVRLGLENPKHGLSELLMAKSGR